LVGAASASTFAFPLPLDLRRLGGGGAVTFDEENLAEEKG
jgi:hypothetical protein